MAQPTAMQLLEAFTFNVANWADARTTLSNVLNVHLRNDEAPGTHFMELYDLCTITASLRRTWPLAVWMAFWVT